MGTVSQRELRLHSEGCNCRGAHITFLSFLTRSLYIFPNNSVTKAACCMLSLSGGEGGELSSFALALAVGQLAERIPAQRKRPRVTDALSRLGCVHIFICSPETNAE